MYWIGRKSLAFLLASAAVLVTGLAGCSGSGDTSNIAADQNAVVDYTPSAGDPVAGPPVLSDGWPPDVQLPAIRSISEAGYPIEPPRFATLEESIYRGLAWLDNTALSDAGVNGWYWVPPTTPGGTDGYWVPFPPNHWDSSTALGVFDHVWMWRVPPVTFQNPLDWNQGRVANGILAGADKACVFSNSPDFTSSAMQTVGGYIVPVYSSAGLKSDTRPYEAYDIAALYAAYAHGQGQQYLDLAAEISLRLLDPDCGGFSTPQEMWAGYLTARAPFKMLALWEIAQFIYFVHEVGSAVGGTDGQLLVSWSEDLTDWVMEPAQQAVWRQDWPASSFECNLLPHGYGPLIRALCEVDKVSFATDIAALRDEMLASPLVYDHGGYGDGSQRTAYMLIGLNAEDHPGTIFQRIKSEMFLRSASLQYEDGYWVDSHHPLMEWYWDYPNTQVAAEVIEALATLPWAGSTGSNMVTGGGSICGAAGDASFGFNVKEKKDGLQGALSFEDDDWGVLEGYSFTSLVVYETGNGVCATFSGTGTAAGEDVSFNAAIIDAGEPGIGVDYFAIAVSGLQAGSVVGNYTNGSYLTEGNTQVHKK